VTANGLKSVFTNGWKRVVNGLFGKRKEKETRMHGAIRRVGLSGKSNFGGVNRGSLEEPE